MDKKITKFDDSGIKGFEFHQYKSPILINNIDINKMEVSNKLPFSKKILNISLLTKMLKRQTFMHVPSKTEYI